MWKATGCSRDCVGCGSPDHFWFQCPHKNDPTYKARAEKELQSFHRPMVAATFQECHEQLVTSWKKEGFPSQDAAALMCQIIDPSTTPTVLAACYSTLANKSGCNKCGVDVLGNGGGGHDSEVVGRHIDPNKPPMSFPCFVDLPEKQAAAYQATLQWMEANIQMSHVLPHIRWPIGLPGTDNPPGTILALLDTGTGLNVGRLEYHESIFKRHPDLMAQFSYLKDFEGVAPFGLGGVVKSKGETPSNDIKAFITYKAPFAVNGRAVQVTFGLGREVATG